MNGFHLTFDPHEYHVYLSHTPWPVYKEGGVAHHLARIPPTGRHVVIVHYYLHIASAHLGVFRDRIVKFREAVLDTLSRNPNVVFAIRGPHVISTEWHSHHSQGGDTQAVWMSRLMRDLLKDIQNKVILLDGWDMSIVIENQSIHPLEQVPNAMIRFLLAFVCR